MGFSGGSGGSSTLGGDSDVALNSPTDGQVLTYNASLGKWKNATLSTGASLTTQDEGGTLTTSTTTLNFSGAGVSATNSSGTVTVTIPGSSLGAPGTVNLDSFSGTTDDDKLTAAFSYIQAQTNMPALQLPARNLTFSLTRTPFSGMRIIGAAGAGPKNLELSSAKFVPTQVTLNCGSGTSAWFYGSSTLYNVYMSNIAFRYGSGASFWTQTPGAMYACEFNSLTHYLATNIFGTASQRAIMTQVAFTGHWEVEGGKDMQFHLCGSDNDFWASGYLNIQGPSSPNGNGTAQVFFDVCQKTNVGSIYVTCTTGWRGVQVSGCTYGINFKGGRFEGASSSTEADGNVFRVDTSNVAIRDSWFGQAMNNPSGTEHGVIEVLSGNVVLDRPTYYRGSTSASVPLLYASGGSVNLINAVSQTSETMYATQAGGTIMTDGTVTLN